MDTLTNYQQIVAEVLNEINTKLTNQKDRETLLSIDHQHGQYILISDGWEDTKRYYNPIVHIEIKPDNSVWLRHDNTDLEIGQELVDRGIARKDIVLAFYSPQMRKFAL